MIFITTKFLNDSYRFKRKIWKCRNFTKSVENYKSYNLGVDFPAVWILPQIWEPDSRISIFFLDMVQQCGSCRVQFSNSDQYRTHYQSDWHCYNLKRKVAQLPPLGLDEFETRKEKITTEKKNSQNPKEKKDKHRKERKNQKKEKKRDQNWEAGDSPRLA